MHTKKTRQSITTSENEETPLMNLLHNDEESIPAESKSGDEMYRMVVNLMNQGLAVHEAILGADGKMNDYRFLDLNPAFERLTGLKKELIIGKTVRQILPNTEETWFERYEKVVLIGDTIDFEDFSVELNRYYQVNAFRNSPGQFTVIISDITEKKRDEITRDIRYQIANTFAVTSDLGMLFESTRTQLHRLFDTTNFVYAVYNSEKQTFTAPYECDVRDIIPEWAAARTLSEKVITSGRSLLLDRSTIEKMLSDGVIDQVGAIPLVWLGVPIFIKDRIQGLLITQSYRSADAFSHSTVDLLESIAVQWGQYLQRLEAEETLREKEVFFKHVTDQMSDNISICDLNLTITYCSPSIEKICGYAAEEMMNQPLERVVPQESYQKMISIFNEQLELEQHSEADPDRHITLEFQEFHRDGTEIWLERTLSFLRDTSGRATGILAITRDITERIRTHKELVTALERAEESDRLKSAFLANMSHEIRTPMNGILGFADLLRTPGLSHDEQIRLLDIVEQSGHRLFNLINDLIDISRIEAGQMPVYLEEVDLNELLQELYLFFEHDARKKALETQLFLPSGEHPGILLTDKSKLHSILSNLIKNSIKFTAQGHVSFGYECKDEAVFLFVADTGIGIPEDKASIIFERFGQADLSFQRGYEGAGLGLSIARAYVEMLGGEISFHSIRGQGTRFTVTLPLNNTSGSMTIMAEKPELTKRLKQKPTSGGLHILVAEDDEVSREYLSIVLAEFANKVGFVDSGTEAVN